MGNQKGAKVQSQAVLNRPSRTLLTFLCSAFSHVKWGEPYPCYRQFTETYMRKRSVNWRKNYIITVAIVLSTSQSFGGRVCEIREDRVILASFFWRELMSTCKKYSRHKSNTTPQGRVSLSSKFSENSSHISMRALVLFICLLTCFIYLWAPLRQRPCFIHLWIPSIYHSSWHTVGYQ